MSVGFFAVGVGVVVGVRRRRSLSISRAISSNLKLPGSSIVQRTASQSDKPYVRLPSILKLIGSQSTAVL